MKLEERDLIRVKRTQFCEMWYDPQSKELDLHLIEDDGGVFIVHIPLSKIPQIIRGLFSAHQRFWRRK